MINLQKQIRQLIKKAKNQAKKMNYMKHHLKRKMTNLIVNKTQVLVVRITTNRKKQKVINY